jgi:hypothetical protein
MGVLEDLGDELARKCFEAMAEMKDDRFFNDVAKVLGTSSPSLQEAFLTSMRLRLAAERGHRFIDDTIRSRREGGKPPAAPRDTEPLGGH